MDNPIVIDPPNFDVGAGWKECRDYVDQCGGIQHADGEVNWRAAFGADPGCCSCPACNTYYWAFGRRQRCRQCGFEYETDAWPMFSYGVQDANRLSGKVKCLDDKANTRINDRIKTALAEKMRHPYYRYGFEHPCNDPWKEFHAIKWREVLAAPKEVQS